MTIEEDLLAETSIPKTSDDSPQVRKKCIFRDDHCTGHSQVVIWMGSIPHGFCNRTPRLQSHLLCHTRNEKSIFTKWLGSPVTFRTADRNDDQVVLFEPSIDLSHIHGLVVHAAWAFHISILRWKLPVTHNVASST